MKKVIASREGSLGKITSVGLKIRGSSIFCALPSRRALWRICLIKYKDKKILAPVLDVGPWNTDDDNYVFGDSRPLVERGVGTYRKPINQAAIDLSDGVILKFGVEPGKWGLREVEWKFVEPEDIISL
jgi:hypothetical protein